jgi:Fic family protein
MKPEDFESQDVGRLVPTVADGRKCLAFVPQPLPHRVEYGVREAFALAEASTALGELAGLARQLPNPALLIGPFIRREAVLSSRIEGTVTDLAELYAYEAGQGQIVLFPGLDEGRLPAPEADRQEVSNYVDALRWGLEKLSELPLSLRLIKGIHARLLSGVRGRDKTPGEFRRVQNWIAGVDRKAENAVFVPPPVLEMEAGMHQLEVYLHEEDRENPPLVRLALLHYQFEALHPFLDGNGRVGRLLMVLTLVSWGLLPAPLLYLSAYFERRRDEYYDRLLGVSQKGLVNEWVDFVLAGIAEQSKDAIASAKRLQELQATWKAQLSVRRSTTSVISLMDSLFEYPVLTIPAASRLLGLTYAGAKKSVEKLVEGGIVREVGPPGRRVFLAEAVLAAVETPLERASSPPV